MNDTCLQRTSLRTNESGRMKMMLDDDEDSDDDDDDDDGGDDDDDVDGWSALMVGWLLWYVCCVWYTIHLWLRSTGWR